MTRLIFANYENWKIYLALTARFRFKERSRRRDELTNERSTTGVRAA